LILATAAAIALTAAASAGQVVQDRFHDEGTVVLDNFCGEPGLTVDLAFVIDASIHVVPHGPEGFAYFLEHAKETDVFTNRANGKSLTGVLNVIEKDLQITDNGDGTFTIVVLATGNAVLYGADGKAIARDPGQVRFVLLVDDGGTPTDPSDDKILARSDPIKGSTGRSDDFCAAAVPALT
jgi:hypothetical protein